MDKPYCWSCGTASVAADIEANTCARCRYEIACAADDDARERAIERAVDEHLDREEERRYG
jgi:hypothetical protein